MTIPPENRAVLIALVQAGAPVDYIFFWGHRKPEDGSVTKSCFSQWYEAAFRINGELFRTAEHHMMVRKARLFGDEPSARRILAAATPNEAKSLGRKIQGFSEETWLAHREEIVFTGNFAKFSQHSPLRRFLLATGDSILVEASPKDSIWGIGLAQDSPFAREPSSWQGLNLLGFALMKVRTRLRDQNQG
ncbi:MAG: NADAR family protein [Opitutaceae bacterium]|jgi:ribA/ribD-fused uncharacterized protein|nr:NADAR family protein [Opitutaceae bacterium]